MKKSFKIGIILVIIVIATILINSSIIFQRGNPIPYLIKAVQLNEDDKIEKVFADKEIYITKRDDEDGFIEFMEKKFNSVLYTQEGSSYIFAKKDNKIDTIVATDEIYFKYYRVWEIMK